MKREIKFRAWDIRNNDMIRSDFLIVGQNGVVYISDEKNSRDYIKLLQYTGMKDLKGIDIYEGDIVRVSGTIYRDHDDDDFERVGYVEFSVAEQQYIYRQNDVTWGVYVKYHELGGFKSDIRSIEVIGNIYENPELLFRIII